MLLFLSHSWHDKPMAFDLAAAVKRLAPSSVDVWHDCESLRLGDSILDSVETALGGADLVTVIWTADAAASAGVRHELDHAARIGRRIVACVVAGPGIETPELPTALGRQPLALPLPSDPSTDELDMVAAGLLQVMVEQLAADPDVALPGHEAVARPLRGVGSTLRHLLARPGVPSVRRQKGRWASVVGRVQGEMNASGREHLDNLASSTEMLRKVLVAVERRPTDRFDLVRLRTAARAFEPTDPVAVAQATRVIDLRLADPFT